MGKKKYTTEISDAFGGEISSKEVLKLAKKIKLAQKKAYPSSGYKTQLKERLENIHLIRMAEDIGPRFSIFQIFGVLASFVFIVSASVMVFDARKGFEQPIHELEQSIPSYEEKIETDDFLVEEEGLLEVQLEREPKLVEEETIVIKKSIIETTLPASEFMKVGTTNVDTIIEVSPEIDTENISEPTSELGGPNISQKAIPKTTVEIIDSDENDSIEIQPAVRGIGNEGIGDFGVESMMYEDSQGIYEYQVEELYRICELHGGTVSDDEYECIFSDGSICNQDNIGEHSHSPCEALYGPKSVNPDVDIDLEELMQEFGQ